ncbi:MAG: RIP metalloprotease RseP [Gammaproteobacteria bacterium]|tara:strand:+ start:1166 stop:2500 length:1335 start_codon:yes stop_codon:yes gene_type:complete
MITIIAFLILLGVLVVIHEGGHFFVLRMCKVHVDRFSVGMGPVIYKKKDKKGTEFALSALPLGGYVSYLSKKALDAEPEMRKNFTDEQLENLFETKPKWQRAAVMFAGPLANFILAVIIFTFIFSSQQTVKPIFLVDSEYVSSSSISGDINKNDILVSINGEKISNPTEYRLALLASAGLTGEINAGFLNAKSSETYYRSISVEDFLSNSEQQQEPEKFFPIEITSYISPEIGSLSRQGPASLAGIIAGDKILEIDGKKVNHFAEVSDILSSSSNSNVNLVIQRNGEIKSFFINTEISGNGTPILGISAAYKRSIIEAFTKSVRDTYNLSVKTLLFIGKMITGNMGAENLSGPVGIAKMSGEAFSAGFLPFLYLMAILSISLGVLNLLPIPVLDGGQLTMLAIEAIRGEPLPARVENFAYTLGALMVGFLLVFAVTNDIFRWVG